MRLFSRLAKLIGLGVSAGVGGALPAVVRPEPAPVREMAREFDRGDSGMTWARRAVVATPQQIQEALVAAEAYWALEFAGWDPKEGRKQLNAEWKQRYPKGLEFVPYTDEDLADWA